MKILVATDSYKGSLGAPEATRAIARGLRAVLPGADVRECPLSDGGEGFVATIVEAGGGRLERAATTNALGDPIEAVYGVLDGGETVAVELSSAAGVAQLAPERRDPIVTTTYGVGMLILAAYGKSRFRRLLLGLGGSATVDGGAGMLEALGVRFLDVEGRPVPRGGGGLGRLASIDRAMCSPALTEVEIVLAVDVTNPLVGARGAAPVYGPQKGASSEQVRELAANLQRYADVIAETTGIRVHEEAGMGSAGGVPAGLTALGGARMVPGFEMVATAIGLSARLAEVDLVVTGEGQLDDQSFEGKVVGRLAERCGERLVAIAGNLTPEGLAAFEARGGSAFSLVPGPVSLDAAMAEAEHHLERTARAVGRLVGKGKL